jgi:hypothetical protein
MIINNIERVKNMTDTYNKIPGLSDGPTFRAAAGNEKPVTEQPAAQKKQPWTGQTVEQQLANPPLMGLNK